MGKKKNLRYFSAWGARWMVEQDMTDVKEAYKKAPESDMVYLKAGIWLRSLLEMIVCAMNRG